MELLIHGFSHIYFVRPVFVLGAKGARSDKAKLIRR
jgi:hypothetical protein